MKTTTAIPYGCHHLSEEDIAAVVDVLRSDALTQGPNIAAFEQDFAEYIGVPHAVACANGTAALHLAALALDVRPGQKVITTPITFVASANCIRYAGGDIVLADIEPETALLDPAKVRRLLEEHPKGTFAGIVPVDFAGNPSDLRAFREMAQEFGLWVLEDACHSPGGARQYEDGSGFRCGDGRHSDLAVFSFHPVKHIAAGEGGMLTTRSRELYDRLCRLRTHGIHRDSRMAEEHGLWYYEMVELGYNYRLTDFQAALGRSQLRRAAHNLARRQELARRYDEAFAQHGIRTLRPAPGALHAYHLYVILVERRRELYERLRKHNIFAQVHYIPVHHMPYYKELQRQPLPEADRYYQQCLSLPLYPTLSDEQQDYVIESVISH